MATVSENGTVTAKASGTATITATTESGGFTDICTVTVTTQPVTDVSLNKPTLTLIVGKSEQLTATIAPTNATNKNISWSSSDNNVATVSQNGLVTAKATGTATITVTTEDGNFKATCAVTVNIEYTITVTGGTSNKATAIMGEEVTLTANTAPAGKEFDRWNVTAGGVTVTNNRFTMGTANVAVEALWKNSNYTIAVTGGTANKATAIMGEEVTLTVGISPTGKEFDRWSVTAGGVTVTNNRFTMGTANVAVEALWKNSNYTITITDGTANKVTAVMGEEVTLTANAPAQGKILDKWTGGDDFLTETQRVSNPLTFAMPDKNVSLTATYTDAIYFVYLSSNATSNKPDGLKWKEEVTITANEADEGWQFTRWDGESNDLALIPDINKPSATFAMPDRDVLLSALFDPIYYSITVNGGIANFEAASIGERIRVTANEAPEGKHFARWESDEVTFDNPTAKETRFYMPAKNVTVTAIFENDINIENTNADEIVLYPNPVTNELHIIGIEEETLVTISDISGKIVLQTIASPNEAVSVAQLPKGVYIVQIQGKAVKVVVSGR